MSLSGLESEAIKQAHETAIADPAGWFLLKYATRAEVELLKGGTGGFSEARDTIAQYEEPSPLFGMVVYRRKKILLKYVPEDTSRLLQARLLVHLQSVVETFPHDALISLVTASDLSETALSSSIAPSLKTLGSVKSNHNKSRPLTEIIEDAGEHSSHKLAATETGPAEASVTEDRIKTSTDPTTCVEPGPVSRRAADHSDEIQEERPSLATSLPVSIDLPKGGASTRRAEDEQLLAERSSFDDRPESVRTITKDTYVPYVYKPKVKLGPRPVAETAQQPRKSAGFSRPVSTLPAGVKMPSRKPAPISIERPQTQQASSKPFFSELGRFAQMSSTASLKSPGLERPSSRSGSVVTVPAYANYPDIQSPTTPGTPTMSLEKQRLMKALEKRKKHQQAQKSQKAASKVREVETSDPPVESPVELFLPAASRVAEPGGEETRTLDKPDVEPNAEVPFVHNEAKSSMSEVSTVQSDGLSDGTMAVPDHTSEVDKNSNGSTTPTSSAIDPVPELANATTEYSNPALMDDESAPASSNTHAVSVSIPIDLDVVTLVPVADHTVTESEHEITNQDGSLIASSMKTDQVLMREDVSSPSQVPGEGKKIIEVTEAVSEMENGSAARSEAATAEDSPEQSMESLKSAHNTTISSEPALTEEQYLRAGDDWEDSRPVSPQSLLPTKHTSLREGAPQTPTGSKTEEEEDVVLADSPSAATITPNEIRDNTSEITSSRPTSEDASLVREKKKRPGPIDPSRFDVSDGASVSEDFFLDEISGATLEQAQPMVVSRSPATPVFPHSRRSSEASRLGRTVTTPYDTETPPVPSISPELAKSAPGKLGIKTDVQPRSVSNPYDTMTAHSPSGLSSRSFHSPRSSSTSPGPSINAPSKKGGVSSLISSRIKALEKLSTSDPQPNANAAVVTPSLVSSRKTSLARTPPTSSGSDAAWSKRNKPYPTPSPSPHGNIIVRTFGSRRPPAIGVKSNEAVSVTTTVPQERGRPTLESSHNSSASIASSSAASAPPAVHVQPPNSSSSFFSKSSPKKTKSKSKTNSVSSISSAVLESLSSPGRASFSSRRSTSKSRKNSGETIRVPASPLSPTSSDGISSIGDSDKKESKKSRLLRRMSSMSFSPRKNSAHTMSPTLNNQPIIEHQEPESTKKWSPMVLGDVNVQFPDTLLWKRRNLEIDSHGYLILAPSLMDKYSKVSTKRYHISEFRMPYMPDQDREELPYSIILDFQDNSTLQCACEHLHGQQEVLHVLLRAHTVFHSVGRR